MLHICHVHAIPLLQSASCCKFRSDERFDVTSVVLDDPDFNLFDSREFFLSPSSDCDADLDVKLQKSPNSTEAKRLQQERRFRVKQIKEGLNAMKKQERPSKE